MPTKRTSPAKSQAEEQTAADCAPTSGDSPKRRGRRTREESQQKKTRGEQSDFLTGWTLDERAHCVRLIRLVRDNYWLAALIRNILDVEAGSRYQWTIKS